MDFGFEKIMEFAMKIDKLNMANLVLVGKVMDKITKRLPKTIFKGKNCKHSQKKWECSQFGSDPPPLNWENILIIFVGM